MRVSIRLNKFLAQAGIASRRRCDESIRLGRVRVNGEVVTCLGLRVDPEQDRIDVDGQCIVSKKRYRYILLNKPAGYLVSAHDPHHQRTVFDLLSGISERLFPVGRLDLDTEGVLLLTNDGELAFRLTHPRYTIQKTYLAQVVGIPGEAVLQQLCEGVDLGGRRTAPAHVRVVRVEGADTLLELVIHEGRKRQVKRMCRAMGHRVKHLRRIDFAGITVEGLRSGAWRDLTEEEVQRLKRLVGL
ncbi:MAG: rRNA pseudouridine synthase [Candidatus Latescibacteria bacterium]|nr:rRNA pseudouridine synthase [Candidatus Latescibacterota bacterium]